MIFRVSRDPKAKAGFPTPAKPAPEIGNTWARADARTGTLPNAEIGGIVARPVAVSFCPSRAPDVSRSSDPAPDAAFLWTEDPTADREGIIAVPDRLFICCNCAVAETLSTDTDPDQKTWKNEAAEATSVDMLANPAADVDEVKAGWKISAASIRPEPSAAIRNEGPTSGPTSCVNSSVNGSLLLSVNNKGGAGLEVDKTMIEATPSARSNKPADAAGVIGGKLTNALHEAPIDALTDKREIVA